MSATDQHLWDSLPDGVVVADGDGLVVLANATARRMLSPDGGDLVGRPLVEAVALQDTEGRDWHTVNRPYDGLAIRTGLTEQTWLTPDGTEVLVTGRLDRDGRGGPVTRVSLVVRSGRGRHVLDRERSDLVATVAHELRSPLTGVKGFVGTLLNRWELLNDEQKQLMLRTVHSDSERLTRLITELLDVARLDTGRLPLYPRETDPAPILRRVVDLAATSTARPIELDVEDDLTVFADPDKFTQVVTNLVDNAVRHGEGTVHVVARSGTGDVVDPATGSPHAGAAGAVVITVSDEGEGIPQELRNRVFTKFWKHGIRGGSGLGMYIVHGLCRVHGGSITIGDAPGGGALLEVVWPTQAPSE